MRPDLNVNIDPEMINIIGSSLKRDDVIRCWNYKRSPPGHIKYENSDLIVLKQKDRIDANREVKKE